MKAVLLCLLLFCVACTAPSPHFRGVPATRITVAGSVFDVRVREDLAEAVRVNAQYAPRFGPIRARAAFAMERVSGCRVTEMRGDQALALGVLACDGRPASWQRPVPPVSYDCMQVSSWMNRTLDVTYADFQCDPY